MVSLGPVAVLAAAGRFYLRWCRRGGDVAACRARTVLVALPSILIPHLAFRRFLSRRLQRVCCVLILSSVVHRVNFGFQGAGLAKVFIVLRFEFFSTDRAGLHDIVSLCNVRWAPPSRLVISYLVPSPADTAGLVCQSKRDCGLLSLRSSRAR